MAARRAQPRVDRGLLRRRQRRTGRGNIRHEHVAEVGQRHGGGPLAAPVGRSDTAPEPLFHREPQPLRPRPDDRQRAAALIHRRHRLQNGGRVGAMGGRNRGRRPLHTPTGAASERRCGQREQQRRAAARARSGGMGGLQPATAERHPERRTAPHALCHHPRQQLFSRPHGGSGVAAVTRSGPEAQRVGAPSVSDKDRILRHRTAHRVLVLGGLRPAGAALAQRPLLRQPDAQSCPPNP